MTLKENIDFVRNYLKREDETSKYHYNQVKYALSKAFNQVINETFQKDPDLLDFYTTEYTGVSLTENATTTRYEADLPAPIIQVPGSDIQEGVRDVNTNAGFDLNFVQISEEDYKMWFDSDSYKVDDTLTYFVKRDKLIFPDAPEAAVISAGIRVAIIRPISEYDDDDHIPMPQGADMMVLDYTIRNLGQIPPVDLRNDNKD